MNLRYPVRRCHSAGYDRLLGQRLCQKILRALFGTTKGFALKDNPDACPLRRERDYPEPAVNPPNQKRECGIDSVRPPNPIVMREERQLLQVIVVLPYFEMITKHRIPPTRVNYVTGLNRFQAASSGSQRQIDVIVWESDGLN